MKTAADIVRKNYVSVQADEPVAHLIGKFLTLHEREACVFDNRKFMGMFSHRAFLKSKVDVKTMKVKSVTVPVPHLKKGHDLVEIAALMFYSNAAMLPVINGEFLGVVHVFDVFKSITDIPEVKVKDVRHPTAITIGEDEKVNKALELMSELY